MRHRRTDPDQRGAWTPFVGVALASLTAGSLVLFSFVAQRTSLDGFTEPGIRAASPVSSAPRSITLRAGGVASGSAPTDGGPLMTLSPTTVALTTPAGAAPSPVRPNAEPVVAAGSGDPRDEDAEDVVALWAGGGESRAFYRDAPLGNDSKSAREDKVKGNAKGARKVKQAKKTKSHKGKSKAAERKRRHGASSKTGHHHHRRSAAAGSSGSWERARPASSSRPAPSSHSTGRHQPDKASRRAPQAHPGHSNTKGNGHSNGRGRGHAHD